MAWQFNTGRRLLPPEVDLIMSLGAIWQGVMDGPENPDKD